MGFIALKCPSCGADITIDDSRDFCFCQYCGTKIVQDKVVVEHRGSVSIDRSFEINNLFIRAQDMIQSNDYESAEQYYNRILDIDATNEVARTELRNIQNAKNQPNLSITITSKFYNKKAQVRIDIDGVTQGTVTVGNTQSYKLPIGTHSVLATIVQSRMELARKSFNVTVSDIYTRINKEVCCKFGNTIEIK